MSLGEGHLEEDLNFALGVVHAFAGPAGPPLSAGGGEQGGAVSQEGGTKRKGRENGTKKVGEDKAGFQGRARASCSRAGQAEGPAPQSRVSRRGRSGSRCRGRERACGLWIPAVFAWLVGDGRAPAQAEVRIPLPPFPTGRGSKPSSSRWPLAELALFTPRNRQTLRVGAFPPRRAR